MSKLLLIPGLVLALILIAPTFPQLASTLYLNLANTQIAHASSLPNNAPNRSILLADADANLARARSFSNQPRIELASARIALARNDAARAVEIFSASGSILEYDPIAQFIWANAAWQANQRDLALAHWRMAGALEYFHQQMHRAAEKHEWTEAEQFARISVGINPDFADGHYILGDALSHLNPNAPDVLRELDRARELTEEKELVAAILSRKGEVLAVQNKLRDALDVFSNARRIAPTDARPRTGYAMASLQLDPGAREPSVELLREVVGDSPWYISAYVALANISGSSAQNSDAQAWLELGLQKNPNNPTLLFALGQFYARQQRPADARGMLTLATKYETHADSLQAIERALAELPAQ